METILNNGQKDFFSGIIANPENITEHDIDKLKSLIGTFPHMGVLRAMLARAYKVNHADFEPKLKSAAAYTPDRGILYRIINTPESLYPAKPEQLALSGVLSNTGHESANQFEAKGIPDDDEVQIIDNIELAAAQLPVDDSPAHFINETPSPVVADVEHTPVPELPPPVDVPGNSMPSFEDEEQLSEDAPVVNYFHQPVDSFSGITEQPGTPATEVNEYKFSAEIDDEVFDEIMGIDDIRLNAPDQDAASFISESVVNFDIPASTVVSEAAATDETWPAFTDQTDDSPNIDDNQALLISVVNEDGPIDVPQAVYTAPVIEPEIEKADEATLVQAEYNEVKTVSAQPSPVYVDEDPVYLIDNNFGDSMAAALAEGFATTSDTHDMAKPVDTTEQPVTIHFETTSLAGADGQQTLAPVVEEAAVSDVTINNEAGIAETEPPVLPVVDAQPVIESHNMASAATEPAASAPVATPVQSVVDQDGPVDDDDNSTVSKYNDESMPYTFMWWLDKTRREHADTYQPYASYKKPRMPKQAQVTVPDKLQQQYYENIFHLTTIEELDKKTTDPAELSETKHKEEAIIDRFIQEEPQMRPPSLDKIDNENKARKSSEDEDAMVTETLANIYVDQMLYHKAISTYKKLLLKFPEKSSYFVAQIKLLETKSIK